MSFDLFQASDYKDTLVWDKDDESAMDFVASCANIRAHIFGIAQKSRFDIKSMAGNIIPAIATTNAVIAGCIVMEGLKILQGRKDRCRTVRCQTVSCCNTFDFFGFILCPFRTIEYISFGSFLIARSLNIKPHTYSNTLVLYILYQR